jgi:hypothetical protein
MSKPLEQTRLWAGRDVTMEVLAIWNPNEELDPWVKYRNILTGQEYECRLDAFRTRYTPRVD